MSFYTRKFGIFLAVVAVIVTTGCANVPSPSVNLLSKEKVPYFINTVAIELTGKPKPPILLPRIQQALGRWPSMVGPGGRPAKLTVQVKNFIHVGPAQALLIGGSSTIVYSVEITDESNNSTVYQVDLIDRVGYSPGGIIAVVAILATDEEDELAKSLAKHVLTTVLKPHNITIAEIALKDFRNVTVPAKNASPGPKKESN